VTSTVSVEYVSQDNALGEYLRPGTDSADKLALLSSLTASTAGTPDRAGHLSP
jgi:hypothetical protein